jgi:hypothetical protein
MMKGWKGLSSSPYAIMVAALVSEASGRLDTFEVEK